MNTLGITSKGISTSKCLISIYFFVPFFSHSISATETDVYVFCYLYTYFFLPQKPLAKAIGFLRTLVDCVDSVKPVFAVCKAALLKIRCLLSLSFSIPFYLCFSLFLSLLRFISVSLLRPFPLSFSLALLFSRPSSLLPSYVSLFLDFDSLHVPLRTFQRRRMKIPDRARCALNR